jgi:hypothetical protein
MKGKKSLVKCVKIIIGAYCKNIRDLSKRFGANVWPEENSETSNEC